MGKEKRNRWKKKCRRDEVGRRADEYGGLKGRGKGKFHQKEDLSLSFSLRIYSAAGSEREKCPEVKRGMIYSSIMVKGKEKIQGAAEAEGSRRW